MILNLRFEDIAFEPHFRHMTGQFNVQTLLGEKALKCTVKIFLPGFIIQLAG